MPKTHVAFYCDADGAVPVLDWFDSLPKRRISAGSEFSGSQNWGTSCDGRKPTSCGTASTNCALDSTT